MKAHAERLERLTSSVCMTGLILALGVAPVQASTGASSAGLLTGGTLLFAGVLAWLFERQRQAWRRDHEALSAAMHTLREERDRAQALLASDPHVLLTYTSLDADPEVWGDVTAITGRAALRRLTAWSAWLDGQQAAVVESCLRRLGSHGESFDVNVKTLWGDWVRCSGQPLNGRLVVRLARLTGLELRLAQKEEALRSAEHKAQSLRALFEGAEQPIWLRDSSGRLTYANPAYVKLTEATSLDNVLKNNLELLDQAGADQLAAKRQLKHPVSLRYPLVSQGQRRLFRLVEIPNEQGWAGMGSDISELVELENNLKREMEAHTRALNQLSTAVAGFDAQGRLFFYNNAYVQLWGLDDAFLSDQPTDGSILDRLRLLKKLPEHADFKGWKQRHLEAYRSSEPREDWWHLPSGQTLRVVANPNTQGGVTYLFDDVSERVSLESKFKALTQVQDETLKALNEGVAVVGTDGCLKLFNPAFTAIWGLSTDVLSRQPHLENILTHMRRLAPDDAFDLFLKTAALGWDHREPSSYRLNMTDGRTLDCTSVPLPDGATLFAFVDVTTSVNAERLLREHNMALEQAARIKNDFVHHVSYALRSPLTNIIGFAQLLSNPSSGSLTKKQGHYVQHVLDSSGALMAIMNDILDLASIDEGALSLDVQAVNLREIIEAAQRGVQDRLNEAQLTFDIDCPASLEPVMADGKRLRQVLFNLLSNAITFSDKGTRIVCSVAVSSHQWSLTLRDQGSGIPKDVIDRVFDRFESHQSSQRHRGIGLGLTLVRAFVELHGGHVSIVSEPQKGTQVTCTFPRLPLSQPLTPPQQVAS